MVDTSKIQIGDIVEWKSNYWGDVVRARVIKLPDDDYCKDFIVDMSKKGQPEWCVGKSYITKVIKKNNSIPGYKKLVELQNQYENRCW